MEKTNFLDIDWLWNNKQMVHYFGLGFIQLKLDQYHRIHFYTKELMKTVGEEEVHNHRYNFVSEILKGEFSQDIYDVIVSENDYTHYMTQESCNADVKIESICFPVKIERIYSEVIREGEKYFMDHHTFHTVDSFDAVTFLTRGDYKKELADVVYPKDRSTVCPFSIKLSESEIFDHLSNLLKQ